MNIDDLIKQKEKLLKLKKELEEKENRGEIVRTKKRIYKIDKNLEIIDTKETRVQEKLEEECTHPVLWQINYKMANLEYYEPNTIKTNYWYLCMHCGKLITDKNKPKTNNIITAPDDIPYVYYIRKKLLPEFQEEYLKIIYESKENNISIEELNKKLNEKFMTKKPKTFIKK
ncbi:MAG: hypothetical protein IKF91_01730 [Bacilli bacterium]|nr:hypothetical protein [Bacilli bacterium]